VHYHIEHHLYPSIPHYRLAECHRRLRARGVLDGAEVATLPEVLRKIFAAPRAAA
jgi:fatty acid desaturase